MLSASMHIYRGRIITDRLLFGSNLIKISIYIYIYMHRDGYTFLTRGLFLIQYLSYQNDSRIFDESLIPDEHFIYSAVRRSIVSLFFFFFFL